MKRLIAIVMALMLCAAPALAELWFTDDLLEDGSPIYYFEELSITLPAAWNGRVIAMEEGSGTSFYQKGSYEKYQAEGLDGGGFLFMLGASENEDFRELPSYIFLGKSSATNLNYFFVLPSDYPAYMGDEVVRAEYDVMIGQVEAVAADVEFYAASAPRIEAGTTGPNDAAETAGEAEASAAPTLEQTRYHFEHNAVPRYFYLDPDNVLTVLGERGTFGLWAALADENGVAYPYQESDFVDRWYDLGNGATMLQVTMPEPEVSAQCYRIYMVYDPNENLAGYFTVEYDNMLGESAFLCGWDAEHTHMNYGGAAILDPDSADYEAALLDEARQVAALAGFGTAVSEDEPEDTGDGGADTLGLSVIECPELGFTTAADPAYAWDYKDGTGITIYTEEAGRIPYVILWQSEDLIMEPFEYIREQYTPHMQNQYGDDLVDYVEYEAYEIGGKRLPAGLYTYKLQGYLIDMLRIYDSTGERTAAYSAKYIQGQGDATMAALDAAIRCFKAD